MEHQLLVVAHLLVIGYWLGCDLAVYYLSGFVVDPKQPAAVRVFCARAMLLLDMLPRTALILTLTLGLSLTAGLELLPSWKPWLALLWLLALAWLALTWSVFRLEHCALGVRLARLDFAVRVGVVGLCTWLTVDALLPLGVLPPAPWLAAKIALMGLITALGLVVRVQLKPFPALFARVVSSAGAAADQAALARLIARVRVPVWVIWIALVIAAGLGRIKGAG